MWYTLAISNEDESALDDRNYYVAELLPETEVAQAEQMAGDWKPGACPGAGNRLEPPGESSPMN